MKLEKVVSRPKIGLYVFLFVLGLAIVGLLATSYNVEIIVNNFKNNASQAVGELPWFKIVLGSLGFIGIIFSLILFYMRMMREMKISQYQADFLDRISHELRTPLSTLTLVSDLLRDQDPGLTPAERDRLWKSHQAELTRLKNDVESLLQAARLREQRQKVNFESLNIDQFLTDKWESFERLLGQGAKLTRKMDSEPLLIRADPELLELILRNLLDNAKKFAKEAPVVELTARRIKNRFELVVTDHGWGFAPAEEKKLFKRFSRTDSGASREAPVPGTGLGLYLSASASRAMGMTLQGMSRGEGQGAEFKLSGALKG